VSETPDIAPGEDRRLKYGWTTGACATAAARAAYCALVTGSFPDPVQITLPKGQTPSFALAASSLADGMACAAIVKDAGDDPDVTHGALIQVALRAAAPGSGVIFRAGDGVGTVTRPGLPLAVGEPAINPAPRRMIIENLAQARQTHGGGEDLEITISVEDGEALARKTWNARLGIMGGLSILGTTGVVVPYSCSAWIHSIHRGIDVARAADLLHIAASTGSTSEKSVAALYQLPLMALIDMGDFVGGTLKYLRQHPVERLTIAGGFAKLSKLAAGHMDLHSKRSQVDPGFLAQLAEQAGAPPDITSAMVASGSAGAVLQIAEKEGIAIGDSVAAAARAESLKMAEGAFDVEIIAYDRRGQMVGRAGFASA
jgi:cobalt-precorrin-5B (C1)-methyltransferase